MTNEKCQFCLEFFREGRTCRTFDQRGICDWWTLKLIGALDPIRLDDAPDASPMSSHHHSSSGANND